MSFNILEYNKKLKTAGVPEEQADLQAGAIHDLMDEKIVKMQDRLVTKEDLLIEISKVATKDELKEIKSEMRWLCGITTGFLTFIMTVLKIFH